MNSIDLGSEIQPPVEENPPETPLYRIVRILEEQGLEPRRSGDGYKSRCPVHLGSGHTLGLKERPDGKVRVKCFHEAVGTPPCETEEILKAIGLEFKDLYPTNDQPFWTTKQPSSTNGQPPSKNGKPVGEKPSRGYKFPRQAVDYLQKEFGPPTASYQYANKDGVSVLYMYRFERLNEDGKKQKTFRPAQLRPDGRWYRKLLKTELLPLYNLPELLHKTQETIFLYEGGKGAEIGINLGLLSTTSALGSRCLEKTDFGPLSGRDVVIVPDNDESGESYIKKLLPVFQGLKPQPKVRILRLPGLVNKKDDAEQFCALPDTPQDTRERRDLLIKLAGEQPLVDLTTVEILPVEGKSLPVKEEGLPEPDKDPHRLARVTLKRDIDPAGNPLLVGYHENLYRYRNGCFHEDPYFVKGELVRRVKEEVDRCYAKAIETYQGRCEAGELKVKAPTLIPVTRNLCAEVHRALRSTVSIDREDQPPFWIQSQPGDPQPIHLLSTLNGLLDLSQDPPALTTHTPRYFSTSRLTYNFDPQAPPPLLWLKLLADQWADDPETIDTIHETLGYLLTSDMSMQKLFLWIGPSRSGRGVMREVLGHLVGHENITSTSPTSLSGPFGLAPLLGKTVAIMGDARTGDHRHSTVMMDRLLRIIGCDPVEINRKNRDILPNVYLKTRFVIISNEMPTFRDSAMANISRYLIIRATREIPPEERDPDLAKKIIANELPGILNLALEGRRRLYARGRFIQPGSAEHLIEVGKDLATPLQDFIEDCYDLNPNGYEKKLDVFEIWKDWAGARGLSVGNDVHLSRNLIAAYPDQIRPSRLREGKIQVRVYRGLRRKEHDPNRMTTEERLIREANGDFSGEDEITRIFKEDAATLEPPCVG